MAKRGEGKGVGYTVTRLQRAKFIASLAEWGTREAALIDSGINPRMLTNLIETDADFAADYEEARLHAIGRVAKEIIRRGVYGWEEPVMGRSGAVLIDDPDTGIKKPLMIKRFSERLALAAAAALNPDVWGAYAGQKQPALPEDMQPDPPATPGEPGPAKPIT